MIKEYSGGREVLTSGLHRAGVLVVLLISISLSSLIFMSCSHAEPPPVAEVPQERIEGGVIGGVTGGLTIYGFPRSTPARLLHRVEPGLTDQAARARIRGILVAALYVDDRGIVRSVRILKGLPFGLEDKAAEAFGEWRFEPARENGRRVASVYQATVSFSPNTDR